MPSKKQAYISHSINKRFRFLSLISLIFLIVSLISLIPSIAYLSASNTGINLFAAISALLAYRTSNSAKPQMAFYYFSIGFLVYSTGNSLFWTEQFAFLQSYNHGLLLLTSLLFINFLVSYATSIKNYHIWLNAGLVLIALLIFVLFRIPFIDDKDFAEAIAANMISLVFLIATAILLTSMFQMRQEIQKHYNARYKNEKQHITKLTNNVDFGYITFRLLYKDKKPANALVDFYNQKLLDYLQIKNIDIDHTKISDLNKDGRLIFESYKEILKKFDSTKSYYFNINFSNHVFKAFLFKIRKDKIGIILTPIDNLKDG